MATRPETQIPFPIVCWDSLQHLQLHLGGTPTHYLFPSSILLEHDFKHSCHLMTPWFAHLPLLQFHMLTFHILEWIQFSFDMYILWIIVLLVVKSRWYELGKDGLRDIAHITHYRQQCTFFKPVYFLASRTRNFRLFLAHFFANLRTFWCTSTGLNNVVVYQNLQIWDMQRN